MSRAHLLLVTLLVAPTLGGCIYGHDNNSAEGNNPNPGQPKGTIYGANADGRVDVTAAEAWPNRPPEPPALSAHDLAAACIAAASCIDPSENPAALTLLCVVPDGSEERAVPQGGANERRSWQLAKTLAAKNDCATINTLQTPRASLINCEEDGCWWTGINLPASVSCAGDVATIVDTDGQSYTRDCSHAYAHCDATSQTGCTDRATVGCDPNAKDRCDGDVKLGCDHSGRVSFHDCARVEGGHCVENPDGSAACVYPDAQSCTASEPSCNGSVISLCVAGTLQSVDCKDLGYVTCSTGRCTL